jgi:hypothetical protein
MDLKEVSVIIDKELMEHHQDGYWYIWFFDIVYRTSKDSEGISHPVGRGIGETKKEAKNQYAKGLSGKYIVVNELKENEFSFQMPSTVIP